MSFFSSLKRRLTRRSVKIACSVVRERDFRLVADGILNLSSTGMLAGPADPVLTGERLIVSFRVPRENVWIDAEATVARVVHGRRAGEHQRALGIEFENLSEAGRKVLELSLAPLPPAPPKRQCRYAIVNAEGFGNLMRACGVTALLATSSG
jgi:hypothetical protein